MGILSGIAGLGKFASNFFGGGAGSTTNTSVSNNSQTDSSSAGTRNERNFSDGLLAALERISADSLGTAAYASDAERNQLAKIGGAGLGNAEIPFDVNSFVSGITGRAREQITAGTEAGIKNAAQATGGSVGGNSMTALLASNLRNKGAQELAGIEQEATSQGVQIKSGLREQRATELLNETQMISGLGSNIDSRLATLLASLKGGEQQVEITGTESSTTTGSSTSSERTPFNFAKAFGNLFTSTGQE